MPENQEDNFVQSRLLVASLLSAIAIMGYFYFVGPPPPETPAPESQQTAAADAPPPASSPTSPQAPAADPAPPQASPNADDDLVTIRGAAEREIVIETKAFRAVFSNRGAVLKSWTLHRYSDSKGGELDLVHAEGAATFGYPFSLTRPGGAPFQGLSDALFAVNAGPSERNGPTTLEFKLSENGREVRKTFRFDREGYVFELDVNVRENGAAQAHRVAWPGGFGDFSHPNNEIDSRTFYLSPGEEDVELIDADDAEEERLSNRGAYRYVGIEDHFFTAVFLPRSEGVLDLETSSILVRPDPAEEDTVLYAAIAVGGDGENRFRIFIGPQDVDELQVVDPSLRQLVDFGFFSFLAEPLFLMLRWIHLNIVSNWGWAIIVITIFINICLFPLKWKGSKSMKRMQQIQPLIKQLNEKYKGLGMTDPKKQKQNEELMALYKKYGVNPAGGCFPMLLQMPFFFAFYTVLTVAIEMRGAEWLWVADLSRPEDLAIRVLPITMIATQFWMQSLTPTPSVDPAQARMMKFMPLMMGFIFYQFSAGLVLYWLTSNLMGVAQQVIINKMPGEPLEIEQPKRKGKKKK